MKQSNVTVERFYADHAGPLGLKLLTGGNSLDRLIQEPTVNRPGLALAGFRRYFANKRVQVLGAVETSYLASIEPDLRRQRYRDLFRQKIPCVVLCRGLRPEPEFLAAADDRGVPVFQTELVTMKFINKATLALDRGIGIINVAAMFGVKSIRNEKRVDLVVTLKAWEDVPDVDRLGMEDQYTEILGVPIPHIIIPVRPGRDLARLVEVAAYQTKLKQSGYNPAKELNERLIAKMTGGKA